MLDELICGEDERAERAALALAEEWKADQAGILGALEDLLHSPTPDHRWWAARTLAEIPDSHSIDLLINALDDEHSSVRQCAALGLRQNPDPRASAALIIALEDDDVILAGLAGGALAAIGEPVVPALIERLSDSTSSARSHAARSLAQIGDPRAIPALFSVIDDESALVAYWAEQGLESMGVGMVFFNPE